MQALILAGGQGTRLRARLGDLPKPLVDVDGVPLLQRQIEALRDQGVTDVVVLVNYKAEAIREFARAHDDFGLRLRIIDDGEPLGTSGAVMAILDQLQERFLVLYGDTLMDVDFGRLVAAHVAHGADGTLFLHPNDHPHDSDLVELNEQGWITAFHKYPHAPDALHRNMVNAALYVLERTALEAFRGLPTPSDFAKQTFPAMIKAGRRLFGYVSFEYIKDIGTPARLDKAVGHLRSGRVARARLSSPQKAVFLDRDGTLNAEVNFLRHHDQLELLPGVAAAIKRLNDAEYRCVVVTNQPVLARGEATMTDMARIHAKLDTLLGQEGAFLDALYLCPHHPHSGYPGEVAALKRECDCRKPGTGMIEQAVRELNIDLSQSWMVGDTTSDLEVARRAGLRSILVRTGFGGGDGKYPAMPLFIAAGLPEAVDIILRH
ncbi:HAD-IIIA family hydrolase [Roseicella aerolata]|uniref:D,D-heptose 1,7-bisphosphate phosphatase n=1 Tax=Roseicella aerolata TaxID=2883479 RepID=A0A9X1IJU4_9PROT|nr:HAD-IIIA family hydrolase [Roseicella aerolata]MCB4825481.1 HAD-IIIA family hydrolase [Roseicella aerolata]